jgi:hypothetical protein
MQNAQKLQYGRILKTTYALIRQMKAKYSGIIHTADASIRQTKPYTAESSNTAEKNQCPIRNAKYGRVMQSRPKKK